MYNVRNMSVEEQQLRKLIPIVLAAALVAGCAGQIIRPKIEAGIEKALPGYIGPAREYKVKASGSSTAMINGEFSALHIIGWEVQAAKNLMISLLNVDMKTVKADPSTRKLRSVGSTTFEAAITEQAVNAYVNASRPQGNEVRVDLEPGKLTVIARPTFLGIGAEVRVTGRPEIAGGSKVNVVADKASVSIVPVPAWVVNKLLELVNPVLDLNQMKFPVELTSVTTEKDTVHLAGTASFKP